ncbi:chromatin assembly complex protein, variant 3 [Coprinopsis cinerea AmutBmut pab1-1]|nr:chromatin assembly complex protein, variant 3 [Coprinopsis cinerea AmutBmut pab1-1]
MVHPHIRPASLVDEAEQCGAPRPPRVEYLATLSRHSAAVNVVRWSPNGEYIASAGDDGMIIIWAPSSTPQATTYGSDLSAEDLQHEKEYWKPRTSFRCTTMQVYDLAWSPTGEYVIAGSTDNTARVFAAADGKCVCEIAEHSHFVQGVAWDPLNEYIATQSSDRSMHIYRISTKNGTFEAHAVGKNTRMPRRHSRTPSVTGRPRLFNPSTTTTSNTSQPPESDNESAIMDDSHDGGAAPLTPAMSVASTPSTTTTMFPPPPIEPSSRRSSFSGSNAPNSPSTFSTASATPHSHARYGRSPSPMPPLPAIRSLPPNSWASVKLYGDESFTNFFRRLTFSPDGGLLMTPAGQFEDPSVVLPGSGRQFVKDDSGGTPVRGRRGRPASVSAGDVLPGSGTVTNNPCSSSSSSTAIPGTSSGSSSSVFIYSRANFARPPIAQLPGHKKASVAVRFSPVLYELRSGVEGEVGGEQPKTATAALEKGMEVSMNVDIVGPVHLPPGSSSSTSGSALHSSESAPTPATSSLLTPQRTPQTLPVSLDAPAPKLAVATSGAGAGAGVKASPALSPMDLRPPTPAASKPSTPIPSSGYESGSQSQTQTPSHPHSHSHSQAHAGSTSPTKPTTGSIFALPYRMLYAVVTMDTIAVYDTQQAGPVALLTKLHYDEFTDVSWSPDGQTLMLSSRDGYCTIIIFDEILPAHHTQQHTLQIQSIAQHHSVPLLAPSTSTSSSTPAVTPASSNIGLPSVGGAGTATPQVIPKKRAEPPLTPAASVDGGDGGGSGHGSASYFAQQQQQQVSGNNQVEGQLEGGGAGAAGGNQEPPKKKRRVALTRVGDLGS